MRKTKLYQNDEVLDYGFIFAPRSIEPTPLSKICASATSSITIVDTNDYLLPYFLRDCLPYLNDKNVVVAGLVSKKVLADLGKKGVQSGFFRATDENIRLGLIIADKKHVWASFGDQLVFPVETNSDEIFQYINHLLWTQSDKEYSFGKYRDVRQTRLSVVMPTAIEGEAVDQCAHEYATEGIPSIQGIIVKRCGEYDKPAFVMPLDCKAFYHDRNASDAGLWVEVIPGRFYRVRGDLKEAESIVPGKFTFAHFVGKRIWFKGRDETVTQREIISEEIRVALDQVQTFEPDFDSVYRKRKLLSAETEVVIDVLPMTRDGSYQLSSNYKIRNQIEVQIDGGLDRLEKLDLGKDIDKKIHSVRTELNFEEKVRLYNELVSKLNFGVEALKNKKNSFPTVNQSRESFVVPHELLGTLLVKGKAVYLAIPDEGKVKDAKAWLKDNGIEATLILDQK